MIYVTEYLATRRSIQNKKLTTNWNISNEAGFQCEAQPSVITVSVYCDEEAVVQQKTNARHLMNGHLRCY